MAVPAYTNDLTDLNDFEGTIPTLGEFSTYADGRSPAESEDYPIQGTWHIDDVLNSVGHGSIAVDNGANITWTSGWAFFVWLVWTAPNAINLQANGGMMVAVGSALTTFETWYVGGRDFGSYPYGGWQNFVVDPEIAYSEQVGGGPGTSYRWVGGGVDCITKVAKGSPLGVDVIRYGRGTLRVAGGSDADGLADFAGMATANDGSSARWGLFQAIEGGYKWKGLMYLGYGALTEFTDDNENIVVDNTEFVVSSFNRIEIHNASSVINWTNINISALGIVSPGEFEMIDNAEFNDIGGVFTDMSTFIYQSNATLTGRTFRRCGQVTQGGATIDSCVFDSCGRNQIDSSSEEFTTLLVDDLDLIDDCIFTSEGQGHAIELTSAHAAGEYTLTGTSFTGYASSDGSTGDEAIYNNSGGAVTINIVGGTLPSIRNGTSASTTLVVDPVTTTITVLDISDLDPIENVRVLLEAADATGDLLFEESVTLTASGTTASASHTGHGLANGDLVHIKGANEIGYNGTFAISNVTTNAYDYTMLSSPSSPATGTITATEVIFNELTDALGQVTDTRSFSVNQTVTGRGRKSTSTPLYKNQPISGEIDSTAGVNLTVLMISDE